MIFLTSALLLPLAAFTAAWEQIERDNALLAIVDIQTGLFGTVRDFDPLVFNNAIYAHAELGQVFDLPVIITTSVQNGPNGPIPQDMLDMYPNVTVIERQGEIDAWANPDFRAAVEATGKKHIIMGGILTDVCVVFAALSMKEAGYSVWVNAEASGTSSELGREVSNDRMARAGVHVVTWYAIVADLFRDWRNPYAPRLMPYFTKYFPAFAMIARSHNHAVENGTIQDLEGGQV